MSAVLLLKLLKLRANKKTPRKRKKLVISDIKLPTYSTYTIYDPDKVCRLCLSTEICDLNPIFDEKGLNEKSLGFLRNAAKISVESRDGFPQNVCTKCKEFLHKISAFLDVCEKSDVELRTSSISVDVQENDDFLDSVSFNNDPETETHFTSALGCTTDKNNENFESFIDAEKEELPRHKNKLAKLEKYSFRQLEHLFCEKCDLKFTSDKDFTKHCLSKEHLTKRWSCKDCKKNFNRMSDYQVHRRVHTHEKLYVCDVCGRGFSYNCSFRNHMLVHKKLFPYKCQTCPHRARNSWAIKMHERVHTGDRPYGCPHCPAKFTSTSNRNRHTTKHLEVRPHTCEQCEKAFASKQNLFDHKAAVHDKIKQYECTQCGITMGFKSSLRKHELKVHKAEKKPVGRRALIDF